MSARTLLAAITSWALCVPLTFAADNPPAGAQAGQNVDAVAEAIFKRADRNGDKKMTLSEFRNAVTMIEQVALSMPAKAAGKNAKQINPQAAALGAPPASTPDFSGGKHLTLEEFKAAYPGLLAQAEITLAQLRAQAAAAKTTMRRGY